MVDYLINFVNHLDPNGKTLPSWPQYSASAPQLLTFEDGILPLTITQDTFRADAIKFVTELSQEFPL